jgi:hypothetical protein
MLLALRRRIGEEDEEEDEEGVASALDDDDDDDDDDALLLFDTKVTVAAVSSPLKTRTAFRFSAAGAGRKMSAKYVKLSDAIHRCVSSLYPLFGSVITPFACRSVWTHPGTVAGREEREPLLFEKRHVKPAAEENGKTRTGSVELATLLPLLCARAESRGSESSSTRESGVQGEGWCGRHRDNEDDEDDEEEEEMDDEEEGDEDNEEEEDDEEEEEEMDDEEEDDMGVTKEREQKS